MNESTIALIILAAVIVLFATEKIPLVVTALSAMLAMVFTGIITIEQAFAGMGNSATLMLIGTGIIAEAFFEVGLSDYLAGALKHLSKWGEKLFIVALFLFAGFLSAFFNGLIISMLFMPILGCIEKETQGRISRKHTFLPMGIASVFGGNLSAIGSTSMITGSGLFAVSEFGRELQFWEPFLIGLAGMIAGALMYSTFGYPLQNKRFDFPDTPLRATGEEGCAPSKPLTWRTWATGAVFLLSIAAFCMGMHVGGVAFTGAVVLLVLRCIDPQKAFSGVNWSTVFTVVGALGFATGISASGAGALIADTMLRFSGPLGQSPFGMCVIFLLTGTLMSNVMSNNATVAILVPIATSIALELGADGAPFVLACVVGANLSVATPICTPAITVTAAAGYRFKDFFIVGGAANVLAFFATVAALYLVYFM